MLLVGQQGQRLHSIRYKRPKTDLILLVITYQFALQALQNNLADVSAKDGSQETCVNLIASFVGILILSIFHNGR